MSIVGNWQREVERFAPSLSVMIHHGAERLAEEAFIEEAKRHDIVITTYALALRDQEQLSAIDWEYVVVDEAQYIKNETAKQTKAIKSIQAKHRIALTGTPVENRLSELWSIMEFLNPHYLGSGTDFRKSFAIPIEKYHDAERAETLKRLIQPFVLAPCENRQSHHPGFARQDGDECLLQPDAGAGLALRGCRQGDDREDRGIGGH